METKVCRGCGQGFEPYRAVKAQQYCSREACQKARRREWQRQRYATDRDYRENQKAARQAWARAHPDYWRTYRQKHPAVVERNRQCQRERNRRRRPAGAAEAAEAAGMIDKMDVLQPVGERQTRRYRLVPIDEGMIAKMDELVLEIGVPSRVTRPVVASG